MQLGKLRSSYYTLEYNNKIFGLNTDLKIFNRITIKVLLGVFFIAFNMNLLHVSGISLRNQNYGSLNILLKTKNDNYLQSSKNIFNVVHHSRHNEDSNTSIGHITYSEGNNLLDYKENSNVTNQNNNENNEDNQKEKHLNHNEEEDKKANNKKHNEIDNSQKTTLSSNLSSKGALFEEKGKQGKQDKTGLLLEENSILLDNNDEMNSEVIEKKDNNENINKKPSARKNPKVSGVEVSLDSSNPILHFKNTKI